MNSARIMRRLELIATQAPSLALDQATAADPAYRAAIDWVLPDLTLIGPAAGRELWERVYGEAAR